MPVKHNVVTQAQALTLDNGIADTIPPGSSCLDELLQLSKEFPEL